MPAPKKAPAPDARRDIAKELAAAEALKFQLRSVFDEGEIDTTLLKDMVEGETNLLETIDRIILQISLDEANLVGIGKSQATTQARKKRIEGRVDTMRTMLASALEILEEKRFERPLATITLKPTPRKLLITEESEIPERFWKRPEPELSKKDLADAIKDYEETLQGKLDEIKAAVEAGVISAEQAEQHRERVRAAFPSIPGAELDGGGTTVQIKFS
jgi:Siphovirus Gp157